MSPHSRLKWTLIAALLIWAPAALAAFGNARDLPTAGLFFLGALGIAYIGTGVIAHISNGYRQTQHRVEFAKWQIREIERRKQEEEELFGRREDDEPT